MIAPPAPPHDTRGRNLVSPLFRFRHKKTGGLYRVIAFGRTEATLDPVVIYQSVGTLEPHVWVRPLTEWIDGRFEIVEDI